jgi:hypothetical protein
MFKISSAVVTAAVCLLSISGNPATAQTIANGPYYATPSWDQTLPVATRFVVLSNMNSEAVLDRETGLVWQRSLPTNAITVPFVQAVGTCIEANIGGRFGWRLPTIHELRSLIDPTSKNLPVGHPFLNVITSSFSRYWSATTFPIFNESAYAQGFSDFHSSVGLARKADGFNYVWCVRGGTGADIF